MLLIFLMRYTVKFYSKIVSVLPWHAHILWFYVWFNVILTVSPNNTHLFYMILCLIQCNFIVECHTKILFYLSYVIFIWSMSSLLETWYWLLLISEKIRKNYFFYNEILQSHIFVIIQCKIWISDKLHSKT